MTRAIFALYLYAGFAAVSFFQEAKQPPTLMDWLLRIGVNGLAATVLVIGAWQLRKHRQFLGFEPRLFYATAAICYAAGIGLGFYVSQIQQIL